ncbi:MAG TPA: hypothetical protein VH280_16675 [Verrucomicrobiae bacterium]|nr:hypothetical protein [Verrucomicrobiae bacterium]
MSGQATPLIDSELAKSLSKKTDQELVAILECPADWRPEVVDFARFELGRRSVPMEQIEEALAKTEKLKDEELQKRSNVPLPLWESILPVLAGFGLNLFGLIYVGLQASRYKSDGYALKSKRMWRLYLFGLGAWLLMVIYICCYYDPAEVAKFIGGK